MLKLFTNQDFINETYRRKLFPLLFDLCIINNSELKRYYCLENDATKANILVVPVDYNTFSQHKKAYKTFKSLAKTLNKPVWAYTAGDFGYTFNEHWYNFRLGGFKSKLNTKSFIIPSFINDPYLKLNKAFQPLSKTEKPQVGFVGHAQAGLKKIAKEFIIHSKTTTKQIVKQQKNDRQSFYPSGFKRANYLKRLEDSPLVETHFILRQHYRAGATTESIKQDTTLAFYNNMFENMYTLCSRGVGNFSVRFYETLAMGRIPILIDTDCQLPLEHLINWDSHVCIVKESDIANLPELVAKFHNSFTLEELEHLQVTNRKLWQEQLERVVYFKQIHQIFQSK